MPIPEFVVEMRRLVGKREMWLPAVTAVVRRGEPGGEEILLVRRADNGAWTPVTGILDPREEAAIGAVREVLEETGVGAGSTGWPRRRSTARSPTSTATSRRTST